MDAVRRIGDIDPTDEPGADRSRPVVRPVHAGPAPGVAPPGVAVLLMHRLRPSQVPWAVARLVRGPRALDRVPGLRFARVLGSGQGGGFGLRPGLDCQGVFATFDTLRAAEAFAFGSPCAAAYRERALEGFAVTLLTSSSRGSWGGQGMGSVVPPPVPGMPVAALTRASIRPARAWRFWRHSPPSERQLAAAPGCRLAVGLGEAPVLRQATFSLWDDTAAMDDYARAGAHQQAIQASYGGGFFSEWMFVRFVPVSLRGRWQGRDLDGWLPSWTRARVG